MDLYTTPYALSHSREIIQRLEQGDLAILPTDTIYGLCCLATNKQAVDHIRTIKQRPLAPFSLWVPSFSWIEANCIIEKRKLLSKLPGPYSLLVQLKQTSVLADNVVGNAPLIAIRIPDHPFHAIVEQLGVPIVATSVNYSGQAPMNSPTKLDPNIEKQIDFCVYEGEKNESPSTIINTITGELLTRK